MRVLKIDFATVPNELFGHSVQPEANFNIIHDVLIEECQLEL